MSGKFDHGKQVFEFPSGPFVFYYPLCANINRVCRPWENAATTSKLVFSGTILTEMTIFCTETAINIGYACNMLTDDMNDVFVISGNTEVEVREELR